MHGSEGELGWATTPSILTVLVSKMDLNLGLTETFGCICRGAPRSGSLRDRWFLYDKYLPRRDISQGKLLSAPRAKAPLLSSLRAIAS